jgi:hypothetical protein
MDRYSSTPVENSEKLPFIGTRFFNFDGGSGTGRSLTIQADGIAIVKLHGTTDTSVEYSGKFSNPITQNGGRLLLKDEKIYRLSTNGEI